MKNVCLIVNYDGTNYFGWQRQENVTGIANVIENAIFKVTGENIKLVASGRTDAGVHARGQVTNFFSKTTIPAERIIFPLNNILPEDIRIMSSNEMPNDFSSRFSATGKWYRYTILNKKNKHAIGNRYFHHVRQKLDIESMEYALNKLVGIHDFASFTVTNNKAHTTIREITEVKIIKDSDYIHIDFKGTSFLRNMIRAITGTLIQIGTGIWEKEIITEIMEGKCRDLAGPTVSSNGLCLMEVYYPEKYFLNN